MSLSKPAGPGAISNLIAGGVEHSGVDQILKTVRKHLGMDVAFVSHFYEQDRVFEHVDSDGPAPIAVGDRIPLEEGYCLKVVRGELPRFIPDTRQVPAAMALPATAAIPIGSHLSIPIELETGEVYGTLCCFSYQADPSLGPRDMRMLHAFAEVLAGRIDEDLAALRLKQQAVSEIWAAMAEGAPRIVYQPIRDVRGDRLAGVECLSRFDLEPQRPPDRWFDAAHQAGVGLELELRAVQNALRALERFPAPTFLGINASPALILSGLLSTGLSGLDLSRIVLEITEHESVADYGALARALQPLRAGGARLAIDDAGAGYASMRHILHLQADVIKLDISLTRDIDSDPGRRALARGLISFAHEIGAQITAEGVETCAELDTLRGIGVDKVQGYLLSKPLSLEDALAAACAEPPSTPILSGVVPSGTAQVHSKSSTTGEGPGALLRATLEAP